MLGVGADVLLTQPKMPTLTAAEKREPKTARNAGFRASGRRPSPEAKVKNPARLGPQRVQPLQRETLCRRLMVVQCGPGFKLALATGEYCCG